jgi:enterochelin esterase-like enzyme
MASFRIRASWAYLLLVGLAACGSDDGVAGTITGAGGKGSMSGAGGESGSTSTTASSGGSTVESVDASSAGGGGSEVTAEAGPSPIVDAGIDWGVMDPGTKGDGDFTIGPNPPAHPDVGMKNVPHGKTFTFTMMSTDSKIFPGTTSTLLAANQHSFTRNVIVYVPSQYVDGVAAPFMVVQDATNQTEIKNTIDNLIPDGRLPKLIAIFVNNGGGDGKGSERGLEYDTMSDAYSRFIDTEVLPAAQNDSAIKAAYPGFKLTDNPEGRSTYGCSSGGAASLTQGWFTPDRYRRIVTYSGTFVDQQDDNAPEEKDFPLGAWEYHSGLSLIANNPIKPLRVFLEVGENDLGATAPESGHHNWVMANQRTAAALKAKGYHYRFVFVKGATHCDGTAVRATLPDTLEWMWQGYPIK